LSRIDTDAYPNVALAYQTAVLTVSLWEDTVGRGGDVAISGMNRTVPRQNIGR